jgi:spore coat protein B
MDRELMNMHVGKTIRVDRGGPESRIGKLLAVFEDYFVLLTENDGVVYYKTNHVRSITESSKDAMKLGLNIPDNLDYKSAENFHKLLESIRFQWVRINRDGGQESLEGVLSDSNKHYASLIVQDEVVRFSMKHIRNISYGLMVERIGNSGGSSSNNSNNNSNEDNDNYQSDDNDEDNE